MKVAKSVLVSGTVQGVGFRPFLFHLAKKHNVTGTVCNQTNGVCLHLEGMSEDVNQYIANIENQAPHLARIENIICQDIDIIGYKEFRIIKSSEQQKGMTFIPTDVSSCKACLKELNDSYDKRRFQYPFTNCTNCGPRFSIIQALPYDREKTTMKKFEMCSECQSDYSDIMNRRFHAQPTCCTNCGPRYEVISSNGEMLKDLDVFTTLKEHLKLGEIIAFKGLGGYQILCDAHNEKTIKTLRNRKKRPTKPLAVMMRDIGVVKTYCEVNEKELEVLTGVEKPIVLLQKRKTKLSKLLSITNTLGVMLPYTPAHELLFDNELEMLVVTSGNVSGLPMIYDDAIALSTLHNVVDLFVRHNRQIENPVDDSVVRIIDNTLYMLRKGRGYSPSYIKNEKLIDGLVACGYSLKNSFSFSKNGYLVSSPYIGSLTCEQSRNRFLKQLSFFNEVYQFKVQHLIHDYHPDERFASSVSPNLMAVYHHHAHVVSCLVDNGVEHQVIGIAFDGNGLGVDGNSWGSEVLIADTTKFFRVGHLKYFKLPGGDTAAKQPWKTAVSLLKETYKDEWRKYAGEYLLSKPIGIIENMLEREINCFKTSSMGRLFDAVAVLLGFYQDITYEGEAAIFVENLATTLYGIETSSYNVFPKYIQDEYLLDSTEIIFSIIHDLRCGEAIEVIAMKFHQTIINCTVFICEQLRGTYQLNYVALSGGVFQNIILLKDLKDRLEEHSFTVYIHHNIACHDEGISVGQMVIANEKLKNERLSEGEFQCV